MSLQLADIKRFAHTAQISVSDEEAQGLLGDLEATLVYIDQVNKAVLPDEEYFVPADYNAVREDVVTVQSGEYTERMLAQAVGAQDGYVKVKKIM